MNRWRTLVTGVVAGITLTAPAFGQTTAKAAARERTVQGPRFEVEMLWPKPMANRWILGSVVGVAVDARDHVFVLTIPDYLNARTEIGSGTTPPTGECCTGAPAVLEYDASGAVVGHWGGPGTGYDWPTTASHIAVDPAGNVWIGGSGGNDTRLLKFSHDGQFIMQVGTRVTAPPTTVAAGAARAPDTAYAGVSRGAARAGAGRAGRGRGRGRRGRGATVPPLPPNSASLETFGGPMNISFDSSANEAYVADGSRNRRVAVIDMTTGAIKRIWGAYGARPRDVAPPAYSPKGDPARHFGTPVSCAEVSRDGLVYVCDRANDRIQVFRTDGSFVTEQRIAPATLGAGSVWDIAFSPDPRQSYLYVADGMNMKVWVLDRATLAVLSSLGDGGRQPGEFYAVSSVATDSRGNLYTGETYEGKRVQKFTFKGIGPVVPNAGPAWPPAPARPSGSEARP